MNIFGKSKPPLHADKAVIRRRIIIGQRIDHLVVLYLKHELAADRTVIAGSSHLSIRFSAPLARLNAQRPGRAGRHAGATELASRFNVRPVKGRADRRKPAALLETQGPVQADIVADPDTASAEDTEVVIAVVERVILFYREIPVVHRV